MSEATPTVYGTCVAYGENAALIRGKSGSGKSDLAYRFLHLDDEEGRCMLVADDRVHISHSEGKLQALPPDTIKGKIELRGVGILSVAYTNSADIKVVVDLVSANEVPRLQVPFEDASFVEFCQVRLPCVQMNAFEMSAPYKLREFIKAASQ